MISGFVMSIYIHVPFCRSKCFYCSFYSVASLNFKEAYLNALCREIGLRTNYLPQQEIRTLYFGGGTPSYLALADLEKIVEKLSVYYSFHPEAERTIEINPEDAGPDKLKGLRQLGFNRVSIGVQTFREEALKRINRTHTAKMAVESVENALKAGFSNVSIDLILGLPGCGPEDLERDLRKAVELPVTHLSVYMLSVDPGSVFEKQLAKGGFAGASDDLLAGYYRMAVQMLKDNGFEHYEISNFARKQKYAVHNMNYWQQKPYIGFGPAAHSYDLISRQWNIAHVKSYIESLNNNHLNFEKEVLNEIDLYNEYIMTSLRTMWGADLGLLENMYGRYWALQQEKVKDYIQNGLMKKEREKLMLTEDGWLLSDSVFSDLFVV